MALNRNHAYWLAAIALIASGAGVSSRLIELWTPPPTLVVEMSSTVDSVAQVYYDVGRNFNEPDSIQVPVSANSNFQELRFRIPRATLLKLRFDPIQIAGTLDIRHMRIVDSDGTVVREFRPSEIKLYSEIKSMEERAGVMHVETWDNAKDAAVYVPFDKPLPLPRPFPNGKIIFALALVNAPILLAALILSVPALRLRVARAFVAVDSCFAIVALRIGRPDFLAFDRLSIWFLAACGALFLLNVALDLNGSSMEYNTRNFHQYGPQTVIAGTSKGIRSDEWNFMTPDMLYQVFRRKPFEAADSPFGGSYASLLGNVPVSHITTIFRPQFWGFFVLPPDYAFSVYWQMKWLIMITGVFALLMVLTGSSWLSIGGSLWLFFSAATQWTYSWPSMLPEMCGLFCFILVLAMYLTIGTNRRIVTPAAVLLAACLVNFAMFAYVPHMLPYAWAGIFLLGGWLYSRREQVLAPEGRTVRLAAIGGALALTLAMLGMFYKDAAPAIAGIGATEYPGHRSLDGGEMWLPEFASHYFAPFEGEDRYPPEMHNISESSGYLWLAPITLLCWGAVKALSKERKIFLVCLWIPALMLLGWTTLPFPAWFGQWFMLDKVAAQRALPAMGFLNMAIVVIVLGAPEWKRKMSIDSKLVIAAPTLFVTLAMANSLMDDFFRWREIILTGVWLVLLAGFLWDVRPKAFMFTALVPSIFFFGLINPIARGIGAITSSPLFQFVEAHNYVRDAKWLVVADEGEPFGIFSACGLDTYTGMHYLPPVKDFPIFRAHGADTRTLNSGGMLNAKTTQGAQTLQSQAEGVVQWNVNPSDPVLKDLGIRYVAFDHAQPPEMVAGLKPLAGLPVSGFWLYELPGN